MNLKMVVGKISLNGIYREKIYADFFYQSYRGFVFNERWRIFFRRLSLVFESTLGKILFPD